MNGKWQSLCLRKATALATWREFTHRHLAHAIAAQANPLAKAMARAKSTLRIEVVVYTKNII